MKKASCANQKLFDLCYAYASAPALSNVVTQATYACRSVPTHGKAGPVLNGSATGAPPARIARDKAPDVLLGFARCYRPAQVTPLLLCPL